MSFLWTVISTVALGYIVLCFLLYVMQDGQVFVPSRSVDFDPSAAGLKFEDLYLETPDGEKINAWYVPVSSNANGKTILFCHGNGGDMGTRIGAIDVLHKMGFVVMIFDYRGYGKSTGRASEMGTYVDARTAWDYLIEAKGLKSGDIVLHGRSLGGAVAVAVAAETEPAVLTLESTFTSAPDMAAKKFPFLPTRPLCRYRYDNLSLIGKIKCPVLIAHSRVDEVIPFSHGQKLFEAAMEPKKFVEIYGDHDSNGLECEEAYQKAYLGFMKVGHK